MSPILVHTCFDPATEHKPARCLCCYRVKRSERDRRLSENEAVPLENADKTIREIREIAMLKPKTLVDEKFPMRGLSCYVGETLIRDLDNPNLRDAARTMLATLSGTRKRCVSA